MKRAIVFVVSSVFVLGILSLILAPQPRVQHQNSSAFQAALNLAVERLEGGGKVLLAGTASPVAAQGVVVTFDGAYTCDTYSPNQFTCDPANPLCGHIFPHTTDPNGHTCILGAYTCQFVTCDTYDPQQFTCDPNNAACVPAGAKHTLEPPPYNHTCEGATCDGRFTCDFTVDPRALTCDAADPDCQLPTFNAFQTTCDPTNPNCRVNNPKGYCTAQNYHTCDPGLFTCDFNDPLCAVPVDRTNWGQVKSIYMEK